MTNFNMPNGAQLVLEAQIRNNRPVSLFGSALAAGRLRRLWAALTRRPAALRTLPRAEMPSGGRYAGLQTVEMANIRGTEGRAKDFDDQFNPLTDQSRQRWQSVASAVDEGVPLPPVQLIEMGGVYYVRDGHHRVSVNRALGQEEIEAEVIVWD